MAVNKTLSEKENMKRFYRHELPEYMPTYDDALYIQKNLRGIKERTEGQGDLKDWFGVQYAYEPVSNSYIPDPSAPRVITDIAKWDKQLKIPDVDAIDWDESARIDKVDELDRENKLIAIQIQTGIWERAHSLMGMGEAYIALITEKEAMADLLVALAEYKFKMYSYAIKYYKPDIIKQHDDYGTNIALQMNPELWRELIKPHIKKTVEHCHANNVWYEQHSCGIIEPIIPDFVEVGVDSWNGMHINNVPELKKITGDKLNYHMTLNIPDYIAMDYMGKLTEDYLRKDVRDTIVECSKGGCYFPRSSAHFTKGWWGLEIINDEIAKIREELTY